jgi:hypothetical protein
MDIIMEDGQVLVKGPKCLIVLTKSEFIQALKRGKAYRRREAMAQRLTTSAQEQRSASGEGRSRGPGARGVLGAMAVRHDILTDAVKPLKVKRKSPLWEIPYRSQQIEIGKSYGERYCALRKGLGGMAPRDKRSRRSFNGEAAGATRDRIRD